MGIEKPQVIIPEKDISTTGTTPDNLVEKAADFLPRALIAIKEYFKEAVFLVFTLGYIFIAAFGHMEKFQNYIGYFFVMVVGIILYRIWEKILPWDVIYIVIIFLLGSYVVFLEFGDKIINWIK